jgi:RNA polymerase sigma-70 factor (ECF subfamily)
VEILPNEADAEEALQDVFMEIWTRAANFDAKKGKPLGWIICMARRRAIDHYRKIRRRAEASEKLRIEAGDGGAGTADHSMIAGCGVETPATLDLRRLLLRIIGSLPIEQERVIHLSYFKEMSQREIAARTGIPLGTIKTRLDLALRKLTQKSMQYREELYHAG